MKYLVIIGLLFSGLFAHGTTEVHQHFFSTLHVEDFTLVLIAFIAGFMLFKYFRSEAN